MAMRAISVFSGAQCDSTCSSSMQEVGQTMAGGERGPVLLVSGSGPSVIINSQGFFSCRPVLLK